jgi:glycosyltransferase involved in cell wall biosynthesis
MKSSVPQLSVVIPAYNEAPNIATFFAQLTGVLDAQQNLTYEIIFVDDGSRDGTATEIQKLAQHNACVRLISFSRNFGKEVATSAGIEHAIGEAIIMVDADGQHPPELIPTFLQQWRGGAKVVIGVRTSNQKEGTVKRFGSKLFYSLLRRFAGVTLVPDSTDFRLIDRVVQQDFINLTERNRITRGLIDWIGYERVIVEFAAKERMDGKAGYSVTKLIKLAVHSFVSLTLAPLYFSAIAGGVITTLSFLAGAFIIFEQFLLHDPMGLKITGTAMLGIMILFLVGLMLVSQGLIALYVSHIHTEAQNRPLYVVDKAKSIKL